MRIKIVIVSAILILSGASGYGDGNKQIPDRGPEVEQSFGFTARRLGVPILRVTIKLNHELQEQGRPLCQIHAEVRSLNPLGFMFHMNNRFTSVMEADTCSPVRYTKEVDQGGLLMNRKQYHQVITFDPIEKKAVVQNGKEKDRQEISVPTETYDPLSMFGRCYLKEELQPGQDIRMSIFDGVKLRQMVFSSKKEKVKSRRYGEIDAVCLESSASFSTFGEKEGAIRIWYALNGKKTPVAMELVLPAGNVKFELEEDVHFFEKPGEGTEKTSGVIGSGVELQPS